MCFTITSVEGKTVPLANESRVYPQRRRDLVKVCIKILACAPACFTITTGEGKTVLVVNDIGVYSE